MRTFIVFTMLSALPPFPQNEETKTLVANIAANEKLYRHIDVTIDCNFTLHESKNAGPRSASSAKQKVRSVNQNEWFSVHYSRSMNLVMKKSMGEETRTEYDGDVTRFLQKDAFGNIHHNPATPDWLFDSHALLINDYGVHVPLSLFLEEGDPFRTHPNGRIFANSRHRVSVVGEEQRDGIFCKIIECADYRDNLPSDKPWATIKLWIAMNRNCLIHRAESWRPDAQGDFLGGVIETEEYQELDSGVWLTKRYFSKGYDYTSFVKERKRDVLQTENHYLVSEVKLNPSYPREFFQQIQFPKGMLVYEVENGKIIRSLIDGIPVRNPASPRSSRKWPYYLATAFVLTAAAVALLAHQRRRLRKSPIPV